MNKVILSLFIVLLAAQQYDCQLIVGAIVGIINFSIGLTLSILRYFIIVDQNRWNQTCTDVNTTTCWGLFRNLTFNETASFNASFLWYRGSTSLAQATVRTWVVASGAATLSGSNLLNSGATYYIGQLANYTALANANVSSSVVNGTGIFSAAAAAAATRTIQYNETTTCYYAANASAAINATFNGNISQCIQNATTQINSQLAICSNLTNEILRDFYVLANQTDGCYRSCCSVLSYPSQGYNCSRDIFTFGYVPFTFNLVLYPGTTCLRNCLNTSTTAWNNFSAQIRTRYEARAIQCRFGFEAIYNQFAQCVRNATDFAVNATASAFYYSNCTTIPATTAAPTTEATTIEPTTI